MMGNGIDDDNVKYYALLDDGEYHEIGTLSVGVTFLPEPESVWTRIKNWFLELIRKLSL